MNMHPARKKRAKKAAKQVKYRARKKAAKQAADAQPWTKPVRGGLPAFEVVVKSRPGRREPKP